MNIMSLSRKIAIVILNNPIWGIVENRALEPLQEDCDCDTESSNLGECGKSRAPELEIAHGRECNGSHA